MSGAVTRKIFHLKGNLRCAGTHDWDATADMDALPGDILVIDLSNASALEMRERIATTISKAAKKRTAIAMLVNDERGAADRFLKYADLVFVSDETLVERAASMARRSEVRVIGAYASQLQFNPMSYHRQPDDTFVLLSDPELQAEREYVSGEWASWGSVAITPKHISWLDSLADPETRSAAPPPRALLLDDRLIQDRAVLVGAALKALFLGIPVAARASRVLEEAPGYGLLHPVRTAAGFESFIARCLDSSVREKESVRLRREAMQRFSAAEVVRRIGREYAGVDLRPTVTITCSTKRPDSLRLIGENVRRQTHLYLDLVLVLHGSGFDSLTDEAVRSVLGMEDVRILRKADDAIFGDCLNASLEFVDSLYFTKFDDDDWYGPEHIGDLLVAHEYSGADIVGKWAHEVYFSKERFALDWCLDRQEAFGEHLPGATILMETALIKKFRFDSVRKAIDTALFKRLETAGGRLYSTHRFNFTRVRHDDHTFDRGIDYFFKYSSGKKEGEPFLGNVA